MVIMSPSLLGDVFEALLGALYLDKGLDSARNFLMKVLSCCPSVELEDITIQKDYKGLLSRYASKRKMASPVYESRGRVQEYNDTGVKVRFLYYDFEV